MINIYDWAACWNVPREAVDELIDMPIPQSDANGKCEGLVQSELRMSASQIGANLWRNNSGVAQDEHGNRNIRYGLGNDSKKINQNFKSSDLIGITPIYITPEHVGRMVGVFTAIEVKYGSWSWTGSEREQAQAKFINLVRAKGGFATFATSKEDYLKCLTNV